MRLPPVPLSAPLQFLKGAIIHQHPLVRRRRRVERRRKRRRRRKATTTTMMMVMTLAAMTCTYK